MGENDSTEPDAAQEADNVQHADWLGPTAAPADPETDWVGPTAAPADADAETAADPETDFNGPS